MMLLFYASLSVIIVSAVVIAFHKDIPGGFVGATCLGGVAVFAVAGFDARPHPWVVGLVASLAGTCLWALTRWRMHRSRCEVDRMLSRIE